MLKADFLLQPAHVMQLLLLAVVVDVFSACPPDGPGAACRPSICCIGLPGGRTGGEIYDARINMCENVI